MQFAVYNATFDKPETCFNKHQTLRNLSSNNHIYFELITVNVTGYLYSLLNVDLLFYSWWESSAVIIVLYLKPYLQKHYIHVLPLTTQRSKRSGDTCSERKTRPMLVVERKNDNFSDVGGLWLVKAEKQSSSVCDEVIGGASGCSSAHPLSVQVTPLTLTVSYKENRTVKAVTFHITSSSVVILHLINTLFTLVCSLNPCLLLWSRYIILFTFISIHKHNCRI